MKEIFVALLFVTMTFHAHAELNWPRNFLYYFTEIGGTVIHTDSANLGGLVLENTLIAVEPLSQYDSDDVNDFVSEGGKVIVSCMTKSINSDWVWENVKSIAINILSPLEQYNEVAIRQLLDEGVKFYYSSSYEAVNHDWLLENAKQVTINIFDEKKRH